MERALLACIFVFVDDEDDGFIERDTGVPDDEHYEYELIGVTVHTGTADGGHYYSFIRDRLNKSESGQDKWCVKSYNMIQYWYMYLMGRFSQQGITSSAFVADSEQVFYNQSQILKSNISTLLLTSKNYC